MSKRILVVEDQPDNRQIIRDMLAPTDYEITEAENGAIVLTDEPNANPNQSPFARWRYSLSLCGKGNTPAIKGLGAGGNAVFYAHQPHTRRMGRLVHRQKPNSRGT